MAPKVIVPAILLFVGSNDTCAQSLPKFMGHEVRIIEPEHEGDGFPKGPASICVEGSPQRQCYKLPQEFGNNRKATIVQVAKNVSGLLFSAESGGVSGWQIHFALLRPGAGKDLDNLFVADTSISNQSQYAFWLDASISDTHIFLTADYASDSDEGHYGAHRYIVSAYFPRSSSDADDPYYYLEDRYMTVRKYDLDANADVLASEKQEILARLRRVKAETQSQRAPR